MPARSLPPVARRFFRYVQIDTPSDPASDATPSTEAQRDLGRLLARELRAMGASGVRMDDHGYVFATLEPAPAEAGDTAPETPTLALLAHQDTSPDAPGTGVQPVLHANYDGGILTLPGDPAVRLDPEEQPALRQHVGHDLITSDGTTLLGSDDKAGVALLMQLAEDVLRGEGPEPRPPVRLCFTVDEEIGRGVEKLDLDDLAADVAYTLDGSGVDTIYAETFNAAEATVRVEGVMVHPGYAKDTMINAARLLATFLAALPADEAPETTDGRQGYLHPHTIRASTAAHAEAVLLLRDFSEDGLQRRKDLVEAEAARLRLRHPRATITVEIEDQYKNMRRYIEATDPRALSFAFAAAEEMNLPLKQALVRGGTDGARLSERGLPTPNLFTGGHAFHSRFEWNSVQNLERALAYLKTLTRHWGKHANGNP